MAFSLSNWFKGKPAAPSSENGANAPAEHVPTPAPTPTAPPSVRTVMPNTSQQQTPVSLRDPSARPPVSLPPSRLPASGKVSPVLPPARKVSFESLGASTPRESAPPPFEPVAPDVAVTLEIGDFLDRLPPNFLQPGTFDRRKKVAFQASELYSDLAKGRASVPASVIYQRCPEIFSRPVSATEDMEVPLPLQKLVEQMGMALSTRTDQVQEENVGQIETPFLQVALEDNARLPAAAGSAAGPVKPPVGLSAPSPFRPGNVPAPEKNGEVEVGRPQRPGPISTIAPVKMPPETPAPAIAAPTAATAGPIIPGKRPPSTVRASVAGGKIRLSGPAVVTRMTPAPNQDGTAPPSAPGVHARTHSQRIVLPTQPPTPPTNPSHQVSKKTARIQIPPISLRPPGPIATPRPGAVTPPPTGPAASEPLTNFRPGAEKPVPPPISFRTSPPPAVKSVPHSFAPPRPPAFPPPAFPVAPPPAATPAPAAAPDHRKIELGLAAILRGLPSSALAVEPSSIPDEVRVSLPFALIEPQLSTGRVTIKRDVFLQAVPEAHQQALAGDEQTTDIQIPLQEVFQNLPANALSLRQDQVAEDTGVYYPTPFSQKADEDAQRFAASKTAAAPVAEPLAPTPENLAAPMAPALEPAEEVPAPASTNLAADAADIAAEPPVDSLPAPIPLTDVEAPADSVPDRARDIPLDLDGVAATAEPTPLASPEPVEARAADVPPVEDAPSEDEPAPEAATLTSELATVEPPALAEAAAPETFDDIQPEPAAAESPATAPEAAPVLPPQQAVAPAIALPEIAPVKAASKSIPLPVRVQDSALQALFMTEEDLDAKTIVKLVCQMPSVTGCAIMFEDGLRLAGNFPDGDTEGFSAMAAPFFKRAVRFVSELELGRLQTFTLYTENGLLSFFMQDNICVSIRHSGRGFMPGVREKAEIVTRELARMYSAATRDQTAE